MSSFAVNTIELNESSREYNHISGRLNNLADRLIGEAERLIGQKGAGIEETTELIRQIARQLIIIQEEVKDYGQQCQKVADVYSRTEKSVNDLVMSLPTVPNMFGGSRSGLKQQLNKDMLDTSLFKEARVSTTYKPSEPIPMTGNNLPAESWLLAEALKDLDI